ncbi:aldo/keto reductase [Pelomyxa schiedti]|nr:aldo/keto reductase [Pelomyxa schiedti]
MQDLSVGMSLMSGDVMPRLGVGTWAPAYSPGVIRDVVLHAVLNCGYRHVDCAGFYGTEREVGEALKEAFAKGIRRQDIWVTSKLWCTFHAPEDVRPAFMRTLEDLGLDYIDLYLIHWPVSLRKNHALPPRADDFLPPVPAIQTWKEMEKLVDGNLVKNLGVSNFTSVKIEKLWMEARIKPSVVQVEMHPLCQQAKLREYCSLRRICLTAYSPLGGNDHPTRPSMPNVLQNATLNRIAGKYNKTTAQVALRWGLQMGATIIPKTTNLQRMAENSKILDFCLDSDDLASIAAEDQHMRISSQIMLNKFTGLTPEVFWDGE